VTAARRKTAEIGRTHAERWRQAETRIGQAAFEVVVRRSVDQLTLAEAGEEPGYSRALPAHYFENREALLVAEHAVKNYRRACANETCWRTAASICYWRRSPSILVTAEAARKAARFTSL